MKNLIRQAFSLSAQGGTLPACRLERFEINFLAFGWVKRKMMEITNLTKTKIDLKSLQKAAQAAFAVLRARRSLGKGEDFKKGVSLVFVGDAKMKEINKKYRNKNMATDVLSFEELNEIFICVPVAKKQAKLLKTGLKTELTRLLTHGIVHLKGYDHEKSAREAERMFRVEEKILKKL